MGIITILIVLLYKAHFFNYYPDQQYFEGPYNLKENRIDTLNDEIRRAKDTLRIKEQNKEHFVMAGGQSSGWNFLGVGLGELSYRDKNWKQYFKEDCISISSLNLNINEEIGENYLNYYTKNKVGYLLTMYGKKGKEFTQFSYREKKIDYKYSAKEKQIYIPIKKSSAWKWLMIGGGLLFTLILFVSQLSCLAMFIKFLISIANNKAFELENVNRLRNISFLTALFVLLPLFMNLIVYIVFILNYSSKGILFNYTYIDMWYVVIVIFFYILYIAFKKGLYIKMENDLTI